MSFSTYLAHTLLIACVGVTMEIVFTAILDRKNHGWRLMGVSYIWMIPIYMMVYPGIVKLDPYVGSWPFLARGATYVVLIFIGEYVSGWLIRAATGQVPWDYSKAKWGVHGLIRLDYAPSWFVAAMIFESAVRVLRA